MSPSDKCIVPVLSPLAAGNKLWISNNGKFFQSAAIYVRACITPPGTFFHIKMFMLMCLLLLHCSESSVDNENVGHSKCLNLLVIYEDLLLVQRLLKYGASFVKRMIVHSPISELFASCSRDPFGTDSCMIN
ncbi:hypothetical protein P5673_019601, partial [Acropora cervicornis]